MIAIVQAHPEAFGDYGRLLVSVDYTTEAQVGLCISPTRLLGFAPGFLHAQYAEFEERARTIFADDVRRAFQLPVGAFGKGDRGRTCVRTADVPLGRPNMHQVAAARVRIEKYVQENSGYADEASAGDR